MRYIHINDFIELFNQGKEPVTLSNYSLQYASSTGTFNSSNIQNLPDITIEPGKYYLIQQGKGVISGKDIEADLVPEKLLSMAAQAGKIALVSNTELISGVTDEDVVDFVGFGSANEFLGSAPVASLSTANSGQRKNNGCQNKKDNFEDFEVLKAAPRNSKSPAVDCSSKVVISQVYGGGGAMGSHYSYDFVELFNPSNETVTLENFSLQYANSTAEFAEKNLQKLPTITNNYQQLQLSQVNTF